MSYLVILFCDHGPSGRRPKAQLVNNVNKEYNCEMAILYNPP